MTRGLLIALEGIDGAGTTTQLERLGAHLRKRGLAVHSTHEPSTGPLGRLIRQALVGYEHLDEATLALLFAADRLDHITREMAPKLAAGTVVLTDRYLLSSLAYQTTALPWSWVLAINERARRPDASILLRVSPETAAGRRVVRGGNPERFDALERQRQVAQAYELALTQPGVGPTYVVDGEGNVDEVARQLSQRVDALLAGET